MLLHYDHPTLYCGAVKTDTIVSQVLEVQLQVQVPHYQARVHVQVQTRRPCGYLRMQVSLQLTTNQISKATNWQLKSYCTCIFVPPFSVTTSTLIKFPKHYLLQVKIK